ncbi:neuroguidin isoform X1 [Xenopus tropicalis]|uniref:Neuroguidin isoform X1 n=1 Tax=Xenopus tropicalis TaxID=8364 RepID=A0A8J0T1B1_XENTR|nr:neuroguidin isoform X1 [Xenopus tropicalis]|eukprot:XP_017947379.1 PREDICTED: neuroguidin isoform X1 [Xenopus tropicalis]
MNSYKWDMLQSTISEIILEDVPASVNLFRTLQDQVTKVTAHVQALTQKVRSGIYNTDKGLSFLELKDQLLLFYLQDLTHLMLEKTNGKSIKGNPGILRLVELRTVLEKMRPIDQKLKYQIDKLVRASVTGSLGENDPLRFKPNPQNLISKLSEADEGESDSGEDCAESGNAKKPQSKVKKYIPPRLAPVHYDDTEAEREHRIIERAKKLALSSSTIRELKEQYSDAPEEIREGRAYHMMRHDKEEQHRINHEESMMVRLNMTRKEKARKKRVLAMTSQLNSLTHFSDISALTGGEGRTDDLVPSVKKSRKGPKKSKKRKGFRKRH